MTLDPTVPITFRDPYGLISDAVERGLQYGVRRAHKYIDHPEQDDIVDAAHMAVMGELADLLEFGHANTTES